MMSVISINSDKNVETIFFCFSSSSAEAIFKMKTNNPFTQKGAEK